LQRLIFADRIRGFTRFEDGYFIATVPSLPGCHTQAKNLDELMKRIEEAIELYLEVEKDVEDRKFVGVQIVEVEASKA